MEPNLINKIPHQRLNVEYPFNFESWLAGVTDGDGTFSVTQQKKSWSLNFQISQSIYNAKLIYYIKKTLKLGCVNIDKKNKMIHYRVRDRKKLKERIIPIFVKNPLLTTKQFFFDRFKKILLILEDKFLSNQEKNEMVEILLKIRPELSYVSPYIENYLCESWIIGFIEAEGSFYIVKKDKNRYCHGFGISQKLDFILLEQIRKFFSVKTKIKYNSKNNFYLLDTTNSRSIENIKIFLKGKLKGKKSVEYSFWSHAFKKDQKILERTQQLLRKIRKKDKGIVRAI